MLLICINYGDILIDVFFDNLYIDMMFYEEIKCGRMEVYRFVIVFKEQIDVVEFRKRDLLGQMKQREVELEVVRKVLQDERVRVFEWYVVEYLMEDFFLVYEVLFVVFLSDDFFFLIDFGIQLKL